MSKIHRRMTVRNGLRRGFTALLCLVMLLGLVPGMELSARADSWATPYLNQLVSWGVMRGDINGNLYPERNITRAEFVTMMNRAYGYNKVAGNPFTDVYPKDWYYDDIDIAYNVGYFNGTSPTTASPGGELTREQAAVLLARNMMLQGSSGETLGFTDSRELSEWSRGLVGAAAKTGVIGGYGDGSFRPQNSITRGEVAAMLARAVGSLISQPGSQSLGSVYGNLTINSSEVSLRNTAVVGNLYLTGGIGLGDVLLENVDVYGEIIVAGAGEANSSQSSVIMRNVTANELIVDNISNQFVTVRAEGDTRIAKTSVRTNAYVEDTTPNGYGLSYIELDGEQGTKLQLAGNIKEVKNLTPQSSLEIVQGSAAKVTSDEHATGSGVRIDGGARVDELNLDVGANVSGDGDIGTMNVGAAGTNVGILPDNITVRPGITSNITGTTMNNVTAAESSADPRLLSGYPAVRNIAPNSATLVFSTNKAGTVYWAVSALADGSVSEDDLINNPTYGGNILKSGRINAASSKTEYTAQVSGLTVDGAYYVSAILVDSRGNRSPLKVTAFSTPDNTTPAFTSGYPAITRNTTKTAQVTVMTNKSCQMYYALLPRGSSTPTAQEFKSGAVSGNLGYGVVDVVKNNTQPVNVNSVPLEELTNYTLYLWLNDYDNARSSGVRAVQFTTPDETPPVVTDIMQTNSAATTATLSYSLNEPGTLHWAVVAEGNDTFMNYELNTTEAKIKTEAGTGAINHGSSSARNAGAAISLTISKLTKNYGSSFDVYYIAKDSAGNYAATVGKINVRTLDTEAPTVTQEFTRFNDDKKDEPLADTDIRLVFSESVQGGTDGKNVFLTLYNAVKEAEDNSGPESQAAADARENLGTALRRFIKLYPVPTPNNREVTVRDKDNQDTADLNWTIDYRFATVDMEDGKMVITFPTVSETATDPRSALNLDSGAKYYFRVEGIYDMALTPNPMGAQNLKEFTTVFARVQLSVGHTDNGIASVSNVPGWSAAAPAENPAGRIDFNFIVDPMSVDHADKNKLRDMLLWSNLELKYTIYAREVNDNYDPVGEGEWVRLNSESIPISTGGTTSSRYSSFTQDVLHPNDDAPAFEKLNDPSWKKMEYAVHIDEIGNNKNFKEWNYNVTMRVSVVAGDGYPMRMLLDGGHDQESYDDAAANGVRSIGNPDPFRIIKTFSDKMPPDITDLTARITDTTAQINLMLNREGTVYYAAAPVLTLFGLNSTSALAKNDLKSVTRFSPSVAVTGGALYDDVPEKLDEESEPIETWNSNVQPELALIPMVTDGKTYKPASPTHVDIRDRTFPDGVIKNNTGRRGAHVSVSINLTNLNPNTVYLLFLTAEGVSGGYDTEVLCYRFTTEEAARPVIRLTPGTNAVNVQADKETNLSYKLALVGAEGTRLRMPFTGQSIFNGITKGTASGSKTEWTLNGDVLFTEIKSVNSATQETSYTYTDEATHFYFTTTKPLDQMNVVDAMAALCYDNENEHVGSAFDVYATQNAKSEYASNIRGNFDDNGTIVDRGTGKCSYSNSVRTYTTDIQCKGMIADNPYAFVCVGSAPGDTSVSFAAYYTISQKDKTPPKIESIICTAPVYDEKKFTKDSQIIINFNEPLWYRSSDNTWLPLDSCKDTHRTAANSGQYYTLGNLSVTPADSLNYEKSACGRGLLSLTFTVKNDASVIYIQIDGGTGAICDSSGNVNSVGNSTSPQSIIITLSCNRTTGEVTLQNLSDVWKADGFTGVTTVG